jgi:glutathione peroxidase
MAKQNKILRFLKKLFIALLLFLIAFSGYVTIVTINVKDMTIRQRILKAVYPAFTWLNKITGKNNKVFTNESPVSPPQSLYNLSIAMNNGDSIPLSNYKGKKLLIVNTASDCGYTDQYDDLQKLYEENKEKLVIIGFPANDFKEQEKGSNEEIEKFCTSNYFIRFKLAKKTSVVKNDLQNPVFQWLSRKENNGWNDKQPRWNFTKYLVNEEGMLTHYFEPTVSPVSEELIKAVHGG